jgi:hypothetical protein
MMATAVGEPKEDDGVYITVTLATPARRRKPGDQEGFGGKPGPVGRSRIPRIARLMALAIKFQDMVDRGDVRDYADLARLGYVTRARITQIMNLLMLAPDIQGEIMGLVGAARETILAERHLRAVVNFVLWDRQRSAWIRAKRPTGD